MARFSIQIAVRWGDLDAFNHVSNVTYLRYIEECRARWMESVPSHWRTGESSPVLANVNMNFRRPLHWPATLEVALNPASPGRSSIKLEHEIRALDADGEPGTLHADGTSTLVWIDTRSGESVTLPQSIRELAAT